MAKDALEGGGFWMKQHYSKQAWMDYVKGHLMEEDRPSFEAHLYNCEMCFQLYMACVSQEGELNPDESTIVQQEEEWIDQIMETIQVQKNTLLLQSSLPNPPRIPLFQRSWLHYTVAAAITIILMAAGLFQGLMSSNKIIQSESQPAHESSYTDQLMDKTVMMLDAIQPIFGIKVKGGGVHE
jgi:anti-sigma factor RsiW